MTYETARQAAMAAGFTNTAPLDVAAIELKPEVRDMCAKGCRQYGKRWSCPPGCGTLEEGRELLTHYRSGILVQTVGQLDDEFDAINMLETEKRHKAAFLSLVDTLRRQEPNILPLGSGACTQCKTCTYPDAPCRFPEKKIVSMEAFGMLVLEVCKANDLTYYYGSKNIAYTACILLE